MFLYKDNGERIISAEYNPNSIYEWMDGTIDYIDCYYFGFVKALWVADDPEYREFIRLAEKFENRIESEDFAEIMEWAQRLKKPEDFSGTGKQWFDKLFLYSK